MSRFFVISGIPASGKSTIGRLIAERCRLSFVDKDEILEQLFEREGTGDADWRRNLSRRADEILRETALGLNGGVLVSWWRHPLSESDSGTGIDWLANPALEVTEVYCYCDPEIAAGRFTTRIRHPGHLDRSKTYKDILAQFRSQAALEPLGFPGAIEIDSSEPVDLERLVREIEEQWL